MTIYTDIMVFCLIWWIVLFMILPLWVHVDAKPEKGHASSAPKKAYIPNKLIITTLVSIPLYFLVQWVISLNPLGLYSS